MKEREHWVYWSGVKLDLDEPEFFTTTCIPQIAEVRNVINLICLRRSVNKEGDERLNKCRFNNSIYRTITHIFFEKIERVVTYLKPSGFDDRGRQPAEIFVVDQRHQQLPQVRLDLLRLLKKNPRIITPRTSATDLLQV